MGNAAEKEFARQLTEARMLIKGPKGRLELSKLKSKPEGMNGSDKAFEFLNGEFLRVVFKFRNAWVEAMPTGVVSEIKKSLSARLGFNPDTYQPHTLPVPVGSYLRQQIYYTENKQKGGF